MLMLLAVLALAQPGPGQGPGQGPGPGAGADGPWNHQIHFATSDDGVNFKVVERPFATRASVPEIIELTGKGRAGLRGSLVVYAVSGEERGEGESGLVRFVSIDGGATWTGPTALRFEGLAPDSRWPVDPAVMQLEDGRLRMYFYLMKQGPQPAAAPPAEPRPRPAPRPREPDFPPIDAPLPERPARPGVVEGGEAHEIGSAVSTDGVVFTVESGVRLRLPGVTDPAVVKSGEEWLMFLSRGNRVLLARSRDGLEFNRDEKFDLDGGGVPGALALEGGRVRVYQTARGAVTSAIFDPSTGRVEREAGARLEGRWADPSVFRLAEGGYVAVFKSFMTGGPGRR